MLWLYETKILEDLIKKIIPPAPNTVVNVPVSKIAVHLDGEIVRPGLYRMESGARLGDAVRYAGGFTARADIDGINLAEPVKDGAKIIIPAKKSIFEKIGFGANREKTYLKKTLKVIREAD